jgi:2-dehydropantoate 2-reductase
MRIGIVGLGAIGGTVAARLLSTRRPGDVFSLAVGRKQSVNALRAGGLHVKAKGHPTLVVPLDKPPDLLGEALSPALGPYELVLLCVRAEAAGQALSSLAPLLSPRGDVVCLQNGLPDEHAAAVVGAGRTLGAVIGWSATQDAAGHYTVTGEGSFTLGVLAGPGGATRLDLDARSLTRHRLDEATAVLSRAFPVRLTHDLAASRWGKLSLNCAISTLGAVSGLMFGELAARPGARTLALRVIGECVEVALALGVRPGRASGLDPAWLADRPSRQGLLSRALLPLKHQLFKLAAAQRPTQKSGMLPRLLAGRTSGQIEDLNGAVVARARRLGLQVPVNTQLLELVRAIEQGRERVDPDHLARLLRG